MLRRKIHSFAICLHEKKDVYLTGGRDLAGRKVSIYKWHEREWTSAPDLNHPRYLHASCSLGSSVYVFGGANVQGSIESLQVGVSQAWTVFVVPNKLLSRRSDPAVTILDERSIVVFGGHRNNDYLSDGFVLDPESNQGSQIMLERNNFAFRCYN